MADPLKKFQDNQTEKIEDTLAMFAAGQLNPAESALIASYLTLNPQARSRTQLYTNIAGSFFEEEYSASVSIDCLNTVLSRIEGQRIDQQNAQITLDKNEALAQKLPQPLLSFAQDSKRSVDLQPFLPGYQRMVFTSKNAPVHAELLQIDAGKKVAEHSHKGLEMTLILDGAFDDETGRYEKGSLIITDEEVTHSPIADLTDGCLCFTTRHNALQFKGAIGKVLNTIFKR